MTVDTESATAWTIARPRPDRAEAGGAVQRVGGSTGPSADSANDDVTEHRMMSSLISITKVVGLDEWMTELVTSSLTTSWTSATVDSGIGAPGALVNTSPTASRAPAIDSSAAVTTEGLLGGTFVALTPGGDSVMLKPGEEITETSGATDLMSLVGSFVNRSGSDAPAAAAPATPPAN